MALLGFLSFIFVQDLVSQKVPEDADLPLLSMWNEFFILAIWPSYFT